MTSSNTELKERIADLLNRSGIDLDLYDLGDLISDIGTLLAEDVERREPYATRTIEWMREGGRSIASHLRSLEDEDE